MVIIMTVSKNEEIYVSRDLNPRSQGKGSKLVERSAMPYQYDEPFHGGMTAWGSGKCFKLIFGQTGESCCRISSD